MYIGLITKNLTNYSISLGFFNKFSDIHLGNHLRFYLSLTIQFNKLCSVSDKMIDALLKSNTLDYINATFEIGMKDFFKAMGKTLTSMAGKTSELATNINDLISFIAKNFNPYIEEFTNQVSKISGVFYIFDDMIMYSRNVFTFFLVNLALIQYGVSILFCIYFLLQIKNEWKLRLKFISTIYFVISFCIIYIKYLLYIRIIWSCYFFQDVTNKLDSIKYVMFRNQYFVDENRCFSHWKSFNQTKTSNSFNMIVEICKSCLFKKDSLIFDEMYAEMNINSNGVLSYAEKGYKVLKKMRFLLEEWKMLLIQPEVGENSFASVFLGAIVTDLINISDGIEKDFGNRTSFINVIKEAESCEFANDLYVYLTSNACNLIPNLIFALILLEICLLLCFSVIPLTF
ncbi:hypothetical protein MHBO_000270 [Bonamia ostreae]|uniref:Gustatory receptor n=1 Tax=Bonamia ostreae TaxID=126728 RepID=A0ABV2AF30_9EUKA